MIGPSIEAMPQTAMAWPCFSRGLMSSSTDWARGIRGAPQMPCSRRKPTICTRFWATPHRAEAMVKPTTLTRNTVFCPNRDDTAPVRGVMIAADTM